MNRYALAPAAFATLLALAGCDLSEPAVGKPETRDFAPRLHEIPVSEIVRLEVSSTDLSNFQGSTKPQSGFYQTFQVQYSSRRISANGIPTGKLYFRLSGLDQSQTPIWVVNKPIPDVPEPVVEIGTTAENSPRIIGIPTITIPSGANYPLITCPYGTPAWTIDGNQPPSANNSSTRYQTGDPVQSNVQLGSGQTLTARCTDRIVWSTSTTYKFTGPNNQPNPSGPGGYFGNKVPVLAIPSGPSGQIEMSINASDTLSFTSYSHWKIAFKFDQGSWSTLTSPGSVPYSSTGMITAYLMAWDGTEWRSGQSVQAAYPKFQVIPPGGPLPIPSVSVYNPIGGTGTSEASINAFASGLSYSGWKAMYRLSGGDTAWKSIEMPLNQSAASSSLYANLQGITGSGTISVYLLAYSSSSQNWVSSPVTTAIYPAASAIGPGTSFPAPQIIPPSGGMGSVTYSFDIATYPEFSNWNVVTKVNAEQPSIQNLSTAASYISGTGTMTAYLVAWSGSAWVAGEAVSKSYPPQPDSAAANGPGTELSQVVIQSPESVPGMVRFSDPGMVTCPSCMNWKVAYKTGSNTTWKIADLSTGVSVRDTSIIDAYLMAWSTNNYKWLYGPTASAKYPDVPTPPVVLPPNGSAMSLNINLPTTLPNPITFSRGAQVSYSHWMVTYKTNEMTEWRLIPLDSSVYMETNGTIYYYPMAWDASSKRWITGSQMYSTVTGGQSINNPEIVPPGGPLAAPVIHGKSSLPSDIPFSLKLTAMDSATYSSGSWKIVYQVNGMGSWSLIEASSTAYVINYGPSTTLRAYVQAWNPTTKRWVSGKDTSISLPIYVKVDAPVFKKNDGTVLGSSWETEGTSLPLRIEGPGTVYYTTTNNEPDTSYSGSNTSRWLLGQKLTYPSEEPMTIKAISVVDGFKSSTSTLEIRRPSWVLSDVDAAGCVSAKGSLAVACGDANGPWVWQSNNTWGVLDDNWSYGQVKYVKTGADHVFIATVSGNILRWNYGSGSSTLELIGITTGSLGGLEFFHDTVWATTSLGPYFYDEQTADWYPAPVGSATTAPAFNGNPGPIWADTLNNQLWIGFGTSVWRYGAATSSLPSGWTNWGSVYGTSIGWIGNDPFNPGSVAVAAGNWLYQNPSSPNGSSSNYLSVGVGSIVQVVPTTGGAFIASDNGSAGGGVSRATGWNPTYGLSPNRKWPLVNYAGVSSQGVVQLTVNGSNKLLATSPQGTYLLNLLP